MSKKRELRKRFTMCWQQLLFNRLLLQLYWGKLLQLYRGKLLQLYWGQVVTIRLGQGATTVTTLSRILPIAQSASCVLTMTEITQFI